VEELPADVPAEAYQYALPSAEERAALAALLAPAQGAPPPRRTAPPTTSATARAMPARLRMQTGTAAPHRPATARVAHWLRRR